MFRVVFLVSASLALFAQESKPKTPGEDWVQLFDGKSLAGWEVIGKEKWAAENGSIQGVALSKEYGYLQTAKSYKDFHLTLKFKCEGKGNSGVFFHTQFKPGTPTVTEGMQVEIDCRIMQHTGGIYSQKRNWIVWPAPENETVVRSDDWNEYQIKVEGNRYVTRLNGVVMIDFTDPKPEWPDGPIALQLHSGGDGNMRFKDIWIRDLSKR